MRTGKTQLVKRLALLVALICLWCSSGAALHHTDDLTAFRAFAAGRQTLHHAAPPAASADACAACQWEQTIPTLHAPGVKVDVVSFPMTAFAPRVFAALHLLPFDHSLLRAPPSPAFA